MLEKLVAIADLIGNTPLRRMKHDSCNVFAKLEYNNYSGSVKDRPAVKIIMEGIKEGLIDQNTTIVESSSGNFAIALASICKVLGLKFISVIDPNINKAYEDLLKLLSHRVVKVTKRDVTGGYLLTRIATVKQICTSNNDCYWTNQYDNPNNYKAYYETLGEELCASFNELHYLFIGVSSCGTITGVSRRVKEKFPHIKVVAVDIAGSIIFNQKPKKRFITGIGASMIPSMLPLAQIDDIVIVSEDDIIHGCHQLLFEEAIFAGASSGASYFAVNNFIENKKIKAETNIVFLCPDKGSAYLDTVYSYSS